jgi:glucosyltransferase
MTFRNTMNDKTKISPETNDKNWIEISDPSCLPANTIVSVLMLTYNHAPFLAQAIEGVLMQQTNFPIEILIGEDCSPDNSRDIIDHYQNNYPHLIRIITASHNVGMTANWERLVAASKGVYLAICEGDDYWIDPLKLQKQVDFLQENQDYGLCYTEIDRLHVATNRLEKDFFNKTRGIPLNTFSDFLINPPFLATCTWVLRAVLLKGINISLKGPVDTELLITISAQSKVKFINETTAIYRILIESASHHQSPAAGHYYRKDILAIQCHYDFKYHANLKAHIMLQYYLTSFLNICQFDSQVTLDDAYICLKTNNKLNIKLYIYYWVTKYKMLPTTLALKRVLKSIYNTVNP